MAKHLRLLIIIVILFGILTMADMIFVGMNKNSTEAPLRPVSVASEITRESPLNSQQDILSPNGKATLRVENKESPKGNIRQTFSFFTDKDPTLIEIFSCDSQENNLVTIPFNTFSPNSKYVFLKNAGLEPSHIVLRTDGQEIIKDSRYVEIESRFYEKHPEYVITDVTGWAGNTLIVVNTNDKEGKIGPSWWFDLSNFSFIRLSTRFN